MNFLDSEPTAIINSTEEHLQNNYDNNTGELAKKLFFFHGLKNLLSVTRQIHQLKN